MSCYEFKLDPQDKEIGDDYICLESGKLHKCTKEECQYQKRDNLFTPLICTLTGVVFSDSDQLMNDDGKNELDFTNEKQADYRRKHELEKTPKSIHKKHKKKRIKLINQDKLLIETEKTKKNTEEVLHTPNSLHSIITQVQRLHVPSYEREIEELIWTSLGEVKEDNQLYNEIMNNLSKDALEEEKKKEKEKMEYEKVLSYFQVIFEQEGKEEGEAEEGIPECEKMIQMILDYWKKMQVKLEEDQEGGKKNRNCHKYTFAVHVLVILFDMRNEGIRSYQDPTQWLIPPLDYVHTHLKNETELPPLFEISKVLTTTNTTNTNNTNTTNSTAEDHNEDNNNTHTFFSWDKKLLKKQLIVLYVFLILGVMSELK